MPRPYHSASSVRLGARCERAWAYHYLDGIVEPTIHWDDIEAGADCTSRQRSLALGSAVHAVGEAHYGGADANQPQWATLPGQIFASGVHLLPAPGRCETIEVEHPIGIEPIAGAEAGRVQVARTIAGVRWGGFRDLAVRDRGGAWLQVDYKTTSNIRRWALTPEGLSQDLQCALYSYDLLARRDLAEVESLWLYLETKRVRRAHAVRTQLTAQQALEIIEPAAEIARRLDLLESSEQAPQNRDACWDYGGCPYRAPDGPCSGQGSIRAFFERKAMDKNLIAKFGQMPPTPPPTPPPTLPPSEEARPDEGQLSLPGSEGVAGASGLKLVAPPPPPSPKKKAKKAATPVAVATSGGIAAELLTLQQQLSAAELEHAAVVAKIAALIGAA